MTDLVLKVPATEAAHLSGVELGPSGVTGSTTRPGVGMGGLGFTAGQLNGLAVLGVYDHLRGISANGLLPVARDLGDGQVGLFSYTGDNSRSLRLLLDLYLNF